MNMQSLAPPAVVGWSRDAVARKRRIFGRGEVAMAENAFPDPDVPAMRWKEVRPSAKRFFTLRPGVYPGSSKKAEQLARSHVREILNRPYVWTGARAAKAAILEGRAEPATHARGELTGSEVDDLAVPRRRPVLGAFEGRSAGPPMTG
jgi:hypothetical protein